MKNSDVIYKNSIRPLAYWGYMVSVVSVNATLLFVVLGFNLAATEDFGVISASRSTGLLVIPILISVFSRKIQDAIAHFKFKNVLPGCRALNLAAIDPRINVANMKIGSRIPPKGAKQNAWWYGLYKTVKNFPEVVVAHQRYILFRDLAFIQAIGLAILIMVTLFLKGSVFVPASALVLYFIFVLATRNRGEQFVQTVMAVWTPPKS